MRIGLKGRVRLAVAGIAFVVGLALMGVGFFSLMSGGSDGGVATFNVPRRQIVPSEQIYDRPVAQSPTPTPEPSPTPEPTPPLVVSEVPYRMVIEKIGVDAPIIELGMDSQGIPEVPKNPDDVAWYNFSANPGEGSNAVFAGHVTWYGPAVFYNLGQLEVGDTVRLVAEDGREYTYRVFDVFSVDPSDPNAVQVMAPTPKDIITLITCGGTWIPDPSARFGGYYTDRLIVQAELAETALVGETAEAESLGSALAVP